MSSKALANCEKISNKLQNRFYKMFKTGKVAQSEWDCLDQLPSDLAHNLLLARYHKLKQISQIKWRKPIHVVCRLPHFVNLNDYETAIAKFPQAIFEYENFFANHLSGNLVIDCEIGYTVVTKLGKTIFNIHAHIICEYDDYQIYLANTKHYRQDQSSRQHYVLTRQCPQKQKDQNKYDYVKDVANYNSKFALLRGQIARNKTAQNLPQVIEYNQLKLNHPGLIRNTRNKRYGKLYFALEFAIKHSKKLIKIFNNWQLLIKKPPINCFWQVCGPLSVSPKLPPKLIPKQLHSLIEFNSS